jgi:putative oxidoreductase
MFRLLGTDRSATLFAQRVTLGLVMFPHGAQKLLGWFGGYGLSATMNYLTSAEHVAAPFALLVVIAESFGALALVSGLLTRVAAAGVSAVMLGAIFLVHLPNGFFMNWFGNQAGEGFEYHLLALGLSVPLIVRGAGAWSLDAIIDKKLDHTHNLAQQPRCAQAASQPNSGRAG